MQRRQMTVVLMYEKGNHGRKSLENGLGKAQDGIHYTVLHLTWWL